MLDAQMILGYDAKRLFNNFTGLGNYSRTLINNLQAYYPNHQYKLFTPKVSPNARTAPFLNGNKFKVIRPSGKPKSLWRSYGITKQLINENVDIFHGLSGELPLNFHKISAFKKLLRYMT